MKKFLIYFSLLTLLGAQEIISTGEILINGEPLLKSTIIKQGDTIVTKANSSIRFNVSKDAFFAKSNVTFKLDTLGKKRVLNVINGGVMAVFGGGNHGISTPNMTAGIRGTGTFTLVRDGETYFCTCHGETEVQSNAETRTLKAKHHNMIMIRSTITEASMQGHADVDLVALEAMIGRTLPAIFH